VKIEYSKGADALYIHLRDAPVAESRDVEEGVTLDFDDNGHIVGLEVLDASERLGLANLVNVSIETGYCSSITNPAKGGTRHKDSRGRGEGESLSAPWDCREILFPVHHPGTPCSGRPGGVLVPWW